MVQYIIGIDEAGRGPLAGPVSVAAIAIPLPHYQRLIRQFRDARDSKKLTALGRESWLRKIKSYGDDLIRNSVSLVGNGTIDRRGISKAVALGVNRCLKKLSLPPQQSRVLLDGMLKAPKEFFYQKTIIRGDERVKIIALASIIAKVHRDRHMVRKAKVFKEYGFEVHKGYGTKSHRQMIVKHGPSVIHRLSFLGNVLER